MKDLVMPVVVSVFSALLIAGSYANISIKGRPSVHGCYGECNAARINAEGSALDRLRSQKAAEAAASPAELGGKTYVMVCQACHGDKGQGLVGPAVAGRPKDYLLEALLAYKKSETRGNQSAVMWGQAASMSQSDMENLASYMETL